MAVILLLALLVGPAQPAPVRVYVFTAADPSGFVDDAQRQRQDSVADVRKALAKRRGIVVVDSREEAQLALEILDRGIARGGTYAGTSQYSAGLRAAIHVGEYRTEIAASGRPLEAWRTIAGRLADRLGDWLEENAAQITAKVR